MSLLRGLSRHSTILWVSVAVFSWSSTSVAVSAAHQQTFLVVLRDELSFREVQSQVAEAPALALTNTRLFHRAMRSVDGPKAVQLVEFLPHIRTLIVESESTEMMTELKKLMKS